MVSFSCMTGTKAKYGSRSLFIDSNNTISMLVPISTGSNIVGLQNSVAKRNMSSKTNNVFTKLHADIVTWFLMTLNHCGGTIYSSTPIFALVINLRFFKVYRHLFLLIYSWPSSLCSGILNGIEHIDNLWFLVGFS